uniref:Germin-like protein n=1 Tax=Picea sitchensis TaxID=3332 RepID=A9NQL9_PICSI|nr:unknown [Picea sitchensis]
MAASMVSLLVIVLLGTFALEPTFAQDFCVADLSSELTPSGYPCKPASSLNSDSFVFTGLETAGNVSNNIGAAVTPAFSAQFPAVNGLGVSIARLDIAPNGVIPLHIHPGGNEILLVVKGVINAGFISSSNVVYSKTLNVGDLMVFPQGLLHYQINAGESTAIAFASFSSPIPGLQIVALSLFASNLPSAVIEKTTFLADSEVKRLKAFLGGSG